MVITEEYTIKIVTGTSGDGKSYARFIKHNDGGDDMFDLGKPEVEQFILALTNLLKEMD